MGTNINILIIFLLATSGIAFCEVIVREYVWDNFNDFIAYGWKESVNGTTKVYAEPSEIDPALFELNNNFTRQVWGWRPLESGISTLNYTINIGTKPEYCGMTNATVSLRYYLEGNLPEHMGTLIYPSCTTFPETNYRLYQCYLSESEFATWNTTMTQSIVISKSKTFDIVIRLDATIGLILIDEVRLTYSAEQGANCPSSCNHDCDYRVIDCHNYYTCIDERYKEFRNCDKNLGLAFNPLRKSCDLVENVEECSGPKPPPSRCICEFRPHEIDCSMYFFCPDTCNMQECEVRKCPEGLLWTMDANGDGSGQQQCVLSSKALCFNETISSTTPTKMNNILKNSQNQSVLYSTNARIARNISSNRKANGDIIVRENVWYNFKDFLESGWIEDVSGTTQVYRFPTEVDPKLYELNKNFTDEVWGWIPLNASQNLKYTIDLGSLPEYCGIINAALFVKYYIQHNKYPNGTYVYPACTNFTPEPNQCYFLNPPFGTWDERREAMILSKSKTLRINVGMYPPGLILIDEVRLSYTVQQGIDCPYSCNDGCDYRGIDCHNYYTCVNGRYKEFLKCDKNDGLAFNPVTKSCDHMENVEGCNEPSPPPPNCVCEFRPHIWDCSLYYFCLDSCHPEQCEERSCPLGLLWSIDANTDGSGQQQCVPPNTAVCYNETFSPTEPTAFAQTI